MNAHPATPRYARPTAASKARTIPKRRTQYIASPRSKTLLRVLAIKPQDPKEPCYFSRLPVELRLQVYGYILPSRLWLFPDRPTRSLYPRMRKSLLPALIHVCGLVRLEVAALLYGSTHISYIMSTFDVLPLQSWLTTISPEHRAHLAKNKNLTIDIEGISYTRDEEKSELCEMFGNRYLIPKGPRYEQFIDFCQLARWLQWCDNRFFGKKLNWDYKFNMKMIINFTPDKLRDVAALRTWFEAYLWPIAQPSIQNAWVRNVRKRIMKRELCKILESVEKAWLEQTDKVSRHLQGESPERQTYNSWREEWDHRVVVVKRVLDDW